MEADNSFAASTPGAESQREKAKPRLVIRVDLTPEPAPEPGVLDRFNVPAIALAVVGVLVALAAIWIGVDDFRSAPPTPAPEIATQSSAPMPQPKDSAPIVNDAPAPASSSQSRAPAPGAATAPLASTKSESPATAIDEVIPDASKSALQTIRGTVRVSIRVSVDKEGKVVSATSHEPGPSRYFERVSLTAAKKWTFAPANTPERRTMLLRFSFTREGVTARWDQPG